MSANTRMGIFLDMLGAEKVQSDLRAVSGGLTALGPASQAGARAATQQLGCMQNSAAQTAAALRMVPAQFTDIVVSLQAGQSPLTVLLQQGGQLKDMFGGAGPAARALGGYVLGLVNPTTLLAAAVGVLGVAYYQGSKEQDNFNRSIIMSGNLAGVTASKLADMAKALQGKGYNQGGAADVLAQLVETGKVGQAQLEQFAAAAMDLEKRAGIPIAKTVENMAALGKEPVQASIRLNEQYGYLTAGTLAQIKALEDEGRASEAAAKSQATYSDAMASRTREMTQNLGYIQRGWEAVKKAATDSWNAMLNIGRPDTENDAIGRLQTLISNKQVGLEGYKDTRAGQIVQEEINKLRTQLGTLQAGKKTREDEAARQGATQATQNAGVAALSAVQKVNDLGKSKAEQASDAINEYRQNLDKLRASLKVTTDPQASKALEKLLDPKVVAAGEASIRKKYADKGTGGRGASAIRTADRRLDLSELQNAMRQEQAMIGQQQQQLELARSAGLISLEDYYAQKRALIAKNAGVDEAGTQEQIKRLDSEKTKGADALNVQKQITDLRGKLAVRQIQTQNELATVDQQAAQAARQHAAAIAQLGTAYEAYVSQLQRRADMEVAGEGMGDRQRSHVQGLSSIRENYLAQMRQLDDQKGTAAVWTPENEKFYNARMSTLRAQQQDEVRIYGETYARITDAQSNWVNGAMRATENYLDSTRNVAAQTQSLLSNAFQGAEDALRSFVRTGKLEYKDLFSTIAAEFVVAQARMAASNLLSNSSGGGLMGVLSNLLGAKSSAGNAGFGDYSSAGLQSAFGGQRANGGPVDAGKMYEVNERGTPELLNVGGRQMLMMAGQSGHVTPLGASGGRTGPATGAGSSAGPVTGAGSVGTVKVEIYNQGAPVEAQAQVQRGDDGQALIKIILREVANNVAEGGMVARSVEQRFPALKGT